MPQAFNVLSLTVAALVFTAAGCLPASPGPVSTVPAGWKTFTTSDGAFAFDYPASFGETVWHPRDWPPTVTVVPAAEDPVAKGCPNMDASQAERSTVVSHGATFTRLAATDVGAGQRYDDFCYYAKRGDSNYVIDTVIWSANGCGAGSCGPYCDTQYEAECKALDLTSVFATLTQMASTFRFLK